MSMTGKLTTVALTGLRNQMRLTNRCMYAHNRIFPSSQINDQISRFHNTVSLHKFEFQPKSSKYLTPILSRSSTNLDLSLGIKGSLEGIARGYSTSNDNSNQVSQHCVKLRGLPFTATKEEVVKLLDGVNICGGVNGVHFIASTRNLPSGMAFVEVENKDDLEKALKLSQHLTVDSRHIDVLHADSEQVQYLGEWKKNQVFGENRDDFQVCLAGLPYESTEQEINMWLSEAAVPIEVDIKLNNSGRSTGKAYAYFKTQEEAQHVVKKMHKQFLGKRYVELSHSQNLVSMDRRIDDKKIKDAFQVSLRGLPYESTEQEIDMWLSEAAVPIKVAIKLNNSGRSSGIASAYFKTQDEAQDVVNKMNKKYLGKRYIEVSRSQLGGWQNQ